MNGKEKEHLEGVYALRIGRDYHAIRRDTEAGAARSGGQGWVGACTWQDASFMLA